MKKTTLFLTALLLFNLNTNAQMKSVPPGVKADSVKTDPTLTGQYQFMLAKSRTINSFKLVNPYRLSQFFQNVKDTLRIERNNLNVANKKIKSLQNGISGLKSEISGTQTSLAANNAKMDEIVVLGVSFSKSNYNLIVWTIIIVLALLLAFVYIRSAKKVHEAKYRSNLYEEISQEFQSYKTKANDKEKKLARELQDERNKLEDLKGNR